MFTPIATTVYVESDGGTRNGDSHNDSNIPAALSAATAVIVRWHTTP